VRGIEILVVFLGHRSRARLLTVAVVSLLVACSTGKERYALAVSLERWTLAAAVVASEMILILLLNAQLVMSLTQEALIRKEKIRGPNPRPKL
jgi:hypothetical protein